MKKALWLVAVFAALANLAAAQNSTAKECDVRLKKGSSDTIIRLVYAGYTDADSISIADIPGVKLGDIDTLKTMLGDKQYTMYHCPANIPDSTHFLSPQATLYLKGAAICTIEPKWFALDTVRQLYSAMQPSYPAVKADKPKGFAWPKGSKPKVTFAMKESVHVGDTIAITIETNFPIAELLYYLESPTLLQSSVVKTNKSTKATNGKPTEYSESRTTIYIARTVGEVAFEKMSFKVAGKKVKVPATKLRVTSN